MITTKQHRHTGGVLPLKAPPWVHNHHHQCILSLLLIMHTIFLHQQTPTLFTTGFFFSIDNSPPLLSNQLLLDLLLDQRYSPPISKIKITKPFTHPPRI